MSAPFPIQWNTDMEPYAHAPGSIKFDALKTKAEFDAKANPRISVTVYGDRPLGETDGKWTLLLDPLVPSSMELGIDNRKEYVAQLLTAGSIGKMMYVGEDADTSDYYEPPAAHAGHGKHAWKQISFTADFKTGRVSANLDGLDHGTVFETPDLKEWYPCVRFLSGCGPQAVTLLPTHAASSSDQPKRKRVKTARTTEDIMDWFTLIQKSKMPPNLL